MERADSIIAREGLGTVARASADADADAAAAWSGRVGQSGSLLDYALHGSNPRSYPSYLIKRN